MSKKLKWACIQPLTGGMYIGAQEAIGYPAEWILSYAGLADAKFNPDGTVKSAGNEYNLLKWLSKRSIGIPYYTFDPSWTLFSADVHANPATYLGEEAAQPDFDGLDLVVAVPVCAGLSMAATSSQDTKDSRNCNMMFLANYVLGIIKPRAYVFENAPTLMGTRGEELRHSFETLAREKGYSIIYYKTDTQLHENCQRRPRTFVIFLKHITDSECEVPATMDWANDPKPLQQMLDEIPADATQQDEFIKIASHNVYLKAFLEHKFGNAWRNEVPEGNSQSLLVMLIKKNLLKELIEFCKSNALSDKKTHAQTIRYYEHIDYKLSLGMNFYGSDLCYTRKTLPAIQFKSIEYLMHLNEDRIYNIREYLTFMGHPYDFEFYGGKGDLPKLGQNVPVNTAKFIVSQVAKLLQSVSYSAPSEKSNGIFQNNMTQRTVPIEVA